MRFRSNNAAASLLQRFINIWTGNLKSGKNGEEQSADHRSEKGEGDDTAIDLNFIEPRNIARAEDAQKIDSPPGEKKSGAGADKGENDTFDQ